MDLILSRCGRKESIENNMVEVINKDTILLPLSGTIFEINDIFVIYRAAKYDKNVIKISRFIEHLLIYYNLSKISIH